MYICFFLILRSKSVWEMFRFFIHQLGIVLFFVSFCTKVRPVRCVGKTVVTFYSDLLAGI